MKKTIIFALAVLTAAALASCNDDDEKIDTEKPKIDATIDGASPSNGSVFHFGDSLAVRLLLTDNDELGSFSVEVHNNFDGHSHSTDEAGDEENEHHHHDDDDGDAFYYAQDYAIPASCREYLVALKIPLPSKSSDGDPLAGGKYHFMLTVTDKAGFSTFKSYEIEIWQGSEH